MTFQDLFKDGLLTSNADLSVLTIAITLGISFLIGIFIYQVYKKTYQSVVYTKSFNLSLVTMTLITSLIIMAVTSNIVLSLGMVGALVIGLVIIVMNKNIANDTPYILLLNFNVEDKEQDLLTLIKSKVDKYYVKSKTVDLDQVSLTIELRIKNGEMQFVNDLKAVTSVTQAMLVSTSEYSN